MALLFGCQAADRDAISGQAQAVVHQAGGIAKSAWVTASQEAQRLTKDSSQDALAAAKADLTNLQTQLSNATSDVDKLRLAAVEEQIARVDAALDVQKVQAEMNEKVEAAKRLKRNADETEDEIRKRLAETSQAYQDLQQRLDEAKQNYDAASDTVQSLRQKLKDAGAVVP